MPPGRVTVNYSSAISAGLIQLMGVGPAMLANMFFPTESVPNIWRDVHGPGECAEHGVRPQGL